MSAPALAAVIRAAFELSEDGARPLRACGGRVPRAVPRGRHPGRRGARSAPGPAGVKPMMAACRSTSRSRSSTTARAASWRPACRRCSTTSSDGGLDAACWCSTTPPATTCRRSPRAIRRSSSCVAEQNLGFGAGHNLLAARHDAAALLFLNPDTRFVEPRTVARLLAALGGDVQAVGPQLVSATGESNPRDHGELHGFRARVAQAAGDSHYRPRDAPADAAWVSGAACLVARRAFDAVGGFDPGFFLYKEEEDLFLRIRRGGRPRALPAVGARAARRRRRRLARRPPARLGGAVRGQAHPLARAAARDAAACTAPWRSGAGGSTACWARSILLLHNRYRAPGGEERAVEDLAWLIRDRAGRAGGGARARLGGARAGAGGGGPARRRAAAGGGRRRGAAQRRARRARPQRAAGVRLARAGGRPRGGRARRAAPAQLPARLRGGDVLHARRGLHALPRPQHAAGRAAELPRLARRGGRLRGVAGAVAAAAGRVGRRVRGPERVRARPAGGAAARRSAAARA